MLGFILSIVCLVSPGALAAAGPPAVRPPAHNGARRGPPPRPAPPPETEPAGEATSDGDEVESVDLDSDGGGDKSSLHATADALMGDDYPELDRVFDHLTARTTRRRTLATLIGHRNYEGVLVAPFRDLLGFDGGRLKIQLGLRYGILDRLDVGVLRMNHTFESFTTYELDTRVRLTGQSDFGLDTALRLGLSVFYVPGATASAPFAQVLLSRTFSDRLLVGIGLLYSGDSSSQFKRPTDAQNSYAVMAQCEARITDWLSLAGEVTAAVGGFHERYPAVTYGPKFVTNRHTFSVVISNTQYTTADSLVAGTYRSNWRDWLLGFLITREI